VLNIFSDRVQLQQIYYQYTATISCFLYISLVYGVITLRRYFPRVPLPAVSVYIFLTALIGAYLYGPLPGAKEANLAAINKLQPEQVMIDRELGRLPQEASVSASNNLASHLSHRQYIYVIPQGIGQAEYVAIFKTPNNTNNKDAETLKELRVNRNYEKYFESRQLVMFRRASQ
jgi:uncharacterized membrane protein